MSCVSLIQFNSMLSHAELGYIPRDVITAPVSRLWDSNIRIVIKRAIANIEDNGNHKPLCCANNIFDLLTCAVYASPGMNTVVPT